MSFNGTNTDIIPTNLTPKPQPGLKRLKNMETYRWHTIEPHNNNEETMNDYLENHLPQCFDVIFEDGTYAEIQNRNTGQIFGINASGDGDFTHHKVEFEFIH